MDLEFFRNHEADGVPKDIRDYARELDEEGKFFLFFQAERMVSEYQRIVGASRTILDLANQERLSLVQLLDGSIAAAIGPTTRNVAHMVTEKLAGREKVSG